MTDTSRRSLAGQPRNAPPARGLTRRELVAAGAVGAAPLLFGGSLARAATARRTAPATLGSLVVSDAELAQVRANIFELRLPFAQRAWSNTLNRANGQLGYKPNPTRDDVKITDWFNQLYRPGLHDGNAAYVLAMAWAIQGSVEHARRARDICLAWARTYRSSRPQSEVFHMVAEPVGPVIKLCMAFDLTRAVFSPAERDEFRGWARQFVEKGIYNADRSRDNPWWEDKVYGDDRTNPAAYSNSATWQRGMAVWAAAAVSRAELSRVLEWNYAHRTPKGIDYGWDDILEGLVIDGTGGEVSDGRYRQSLEYGMYAWEPLILIADVARRARFRIDLFTYGTRRNGYSILTPVPYFAPFLMSESVTKDLEKTDYGKDWPKAASRWRALYEVLYRNASDPSTVKLLRKVVNYGGPQRRGDNYDIYITNFGALLGRGPKGPMPAVPAKPKPKSKPKSK